MAHFAQIDASGTVTQVIVVDNSVLMDEHGFEAEHLGALFCGRLFGGTWVQTFYSGKRRKHFAGVGYTYDKARDAFIPPRPGDDWTFDEDACAWIAPDTPEETESV